LLKGSTQPREGKIEVRDKRERQRERETERETGRDVSKQDRVTLPYHRPPHKRLQESRKEW
jgi:hypothetical protein